MNIIIHPHAMERLTERGTSVDEIMSTIQTGEKYPAKLGRSGFRKNFHFGKTRHGKFYKTKQLEVIAVEETLDVWIALTVITKYF